MAAETEVATAASHPIVAYTGTVKPFLLAHPIGVAIVGGIIVGAGTYWAVKKFSKKQEEEQPQPA